MEQIFTRNQNLKYELIQNKEIFRFLNSGKLGLNLILDYLSSLNKFDQKFDEVLIPKYMGQWIYSSLNQKCITTPVFTKNTKIIYIYHQFGVPQKFTELKKFARENDLLIIEDCAHILDGYMNEKDRIGYLGDFTIFSYSKFFKCYLLGGIRSNSRDFIDYFDNQISRSSKIQSFINYLLIRLGYAMKMNSNLRKKFFNMNYSLYNFPSKHLIFLQKIFEQQLSKEFNLRLKRFQYAKVKLGNIKEMDFLKYQDLILFKMPIILNPNLKQKIIKKFEIEKLKYELMHFDINRNMLNPDYQKVIIIDIGSENKDFEKQIEIILNV